MFHKIIKRFRVYWHDLYYFVFSKKGADFALTCREVTETVDLADSDKSSLHKTKVTLHISLCQACNNYNSFSRLLKKLTTELISAHEVHKPKLKKLEEELLKKYAKK